MNRKYSKLSHQLDNLPFIDSVKMKFATTSYEFLQAMKLIHIAYADKAIINNDNKECYFSPYSVLPKNKIIVIKKDDNVIGTISLIEDSPLGIPMDKVYPEEIDSLREERANFIEISAFAVDPKYHNYGLSLLLYRAAFIYISQYTNVDYVVIAVHPRVSALYNDLFHFEIFGSEKKYKSLNNVRAVPLRAKKTDSADFIKTNGILNRKFKKMNILSEYCDSLNCFNSKEADIKNILIWEDACISEYFKKCQIKLNELPEKQREIISWLYPVLRNQ